MRTSKSRIGKQTLAGLGLCAAGILSQASAAGLSRDDARECYLATLKDASLETNRTGLRACGMALEATDDSEARAGLLANRAYIRLRMTDYSGTVADADADLRADGGAVAHPFVGDGFKLAAFNPVIIVVQFAQDGYGQSGAVHHLAGFNSY